MSDAETVSLFIACETTSDISAGVEGLLVVV